MTDRKVQNLALHSIFPVYRKEALTFQLVWAFHFVLAYKRIFSKQCKHCITLARKFCHAERTTNGTPLCTQESLSDVQEQLDTQVQS